MRAVRRPSDPTACATPSTSGRRTGAPGRVSTARSSQTTTASSTKTESGVVGGGRRPDRPAAVRQRVAIGRMLGPGRSTSTGVRLMWVTMPSASLLLGRRTKAVPFIGIAPFLTGASSCHPAGRRCLAGDRPVAGTSGDTGQPNVHAAWRMAQAATGRPGVPAKPEARGAGRGRLVGSGLADQFSDLELDCYWFSAPRDPDRTGPSSRSAVT